MGVPLYPPTEQHVSQDPGVVCMCWCRFVPEHPVPRPGPGVTSRGCSSSPWKWIHLPSLQNCLRCHVHSAPPSHSGHQPGSPSAQHCSPVHQLQVVVESSASTAPCLICGSLASSACGWKILCSQRQPST